MGMICTNNCHLRIISKNEIIIVNNLMKNLALHRGLTNNSSIPHKYFGDVRISKILIQFPKFTGEYGKH
jgi:hypothetical protein